MRKSKEEIVSELKASFDALEQAMLAVPDSRFNIANNNKWTTGENIRHIIISTKMTRRAFKFPKFLLFLLYGRPGRTSHGYSKVVENYTKKLEDGAKARGVYVPMEINYDKERLKNKLKRESEKLISAINDKWTDEQMDHYQLPHPLLKLITVRELAYFTIYHNGHHLESIRKNYLQ